jgi:hypothetical protein
MKTEQLQKQREISIDAKLNKIASLLEVLIKMQEEESYPLESKMKTSFIKECQKILKEMKIQKAKIHTYKSMAEFTKTLG